METLTDYSSNIPILENYLEEKFVSLSFCGANCGLTSPSALLVNIVVSQIGLSSVIVY
jgi:hypothetical protein